MAVLDLFGCMDAISTIPEAIPGVGFAKLALTKGRTKAPIIIKIIIAAIAAKIMKIMSTVLAEVFALIKDSRSFLALTTESIFWVQSKRNVAM